MSYSVKIYELAKFIYERYEALSEEEGWQKTDVDFDDLPEEQIKIYIGLAGSVIGYITNELDRTSRILL